MERYGKSWTVKKAELTDAQSTSSDTEHTLSLPNPILAFLQPTHAILFHPVIFLAFLRRLLRTRIFLLPLLSQCFFYRRPKVDRLRQYTSQSIYRISIRNGRRVEPIFWEGAVQRDEVGVKGNYFSMKDEVARVGRYFRRRRCVSKDVRVWND